MDDDSVYYVVPANWLEMATEKQPEVMHAVAAALQAAASAPSADDEPYELEASMRKVLAELAAREVQGWKVVELTFGPPALTGIVVHIGDDAYVLMGFPMDALSLEEMSAQVVEQLTALRQRVGDDSG